MAFDAMLEGKEEEVATGGGGDDMDADEYLLAKTVYKSNILDSVASSNAFFKSQQRGEKDLTFEEKREIARDLLDKNQSLFLQRYWKFINVRDLPFFDDVCSDYEVDFYIKEIRRCSNEKSRRAKCHNRRYEALKKMVKEGSYFSLDAMRERNPHLFDQLVGRYLSDEMRAAMRKNDAKNSTFASFLIDCIDKKCIENLRQRQQDEEDAVVEEEEDDDSSEESEMEDDYEQPCTSRGPINLPEAERQMLISEFTNMMYESFLSGRDINFDYSLVDDNEEYDSVKEREVDEEERYFDAD